MAGVQQLDTCYHQNGVVKYYDLLKTDQILLTKAPQFDPNKVYQVGHQFLSFLQEKCNQDPGAYWLQKSAEDNVIHLYYLPVMTKQYPLSDPLPPFVSIGRSESLTFFGDLLYPVVQRLTEAPENREKCIEYFQLCSELLNEPRHMVVRASVYGQLARLFLSKSDFPKGLHYIFKGITSLRCARQVQWAEVEVIDRKLWEIVFRLGIYLLRRHAYKRDDPSTLVLKVPLEVYEELERIGCRFHYPSSKQMEVDGFLKAGLHCFQQAETALGKLSDDMLKEKGGVYIEIGDGYEVNKKWVDAEGFFSMALNAFRVALDYANIFLVYRKLGGVSFEMANELHLTLGAMWKNVVACPKDAFKSTFKDTHRAAMIHCCKAIEFFSLANSELGNIGNGEANDITKSFYSGYAFSYMLLHLLFDLGDKVSVCDMSDSSVKIKITDVGQTRMMVMTAEEAMRKCLGIFESKGLDVKDRVCLYASW